MDRGKIKIIEFGKDEEEARALSVDAAGTSRMKILEFGDASSGGNERSPRKVGGRAHPDRRVRRRAVRCDGVAGSDSCAASTGSPDASRRHQDQGIRRGGKGAAARRGTRRPAHEDTGIRLMRGRLHGASVRAESGTRTKWHLLSSPPVQAPPAGFGPVGSRFRGNDGKLGPIRSLSFPRNREPIGLTNSRKRPTKRALSTWRSRQ